jgi:peptidoglycan/xylan/chitin deacetylase (PgdA/CDA1 family)
MSQKNRKSRKDAFRVLLFHAVVAERPKSVGWLERKYWMSAAEFRTHLSGLCARKLPVLTLESAWNAKPNSSQLDPILWPTPEAAPVVLTFDDGHASDAAVVWPMLQEAGLTATFFVNTATLGKPGHLRWREVREMSRAGACFASHGHRHIDMTALGSRALDVELRMSKDLLEGWIGQPVDFFAAPYGRANRRVFDAALRAGYRAVCTSELKPARRGSSSVSRVAIHAGTAREEFAGLLDGRRFPYWSRRARAACLRVPKLVLPAPHPRPAIQPEAAR